MVSRGRGRQRISTDDLNREVRRLLDRDPDLSRSAITRELRGRGVAVGSERIRASVRAGRITSGQVQTGLLDVVGTLRSPGLTLVAGGASLRQGTRAETATFAAIDWRVTYSVNVYYRGRLQSRRTDGLTGRTIQDLRRYNRDLIETQIQNQIQGRLYAMFESPDDSDLYSYDFTQFDVEIVNVELRGDTQRRGRRQRRNG